MVKKCSNYSHSAKRNPLGSILSLTRDVVGNTVTM
jgi:hypothetical protein